YERSLDPAGTGEMRTECRIARDGTVQWLAWTGRTYFTQSASGRVPVRQLGAAIDITERRRREDERQVFVSLLETASDFIGIADPTGKPIWVNPAGRRMVGLPADLPISETEIADYYAPEQRAFATDVIVKAMIERGHWSGETWFFNRQTGERIPVSDEHFLIRDATGARVLGMATITRDISQARRTSDRLRESEARFRLMMDGAPIGMALVALDGRFVRVNRRLCEIVGYTAEELEQLRFQDITHPDDLGTDVELGLRLARGEMPRFQVEKRYIRKDGAIVTVLLSVSILRVGGGAPDYFIGQIEDISERKRAERALQLSEARFSGIVSMSPDAIISVDEEQRITLFNQGAERIFGYARAEVMGAPLDFIVPERPPDVDRRMGERIGTIIGRRKSGEAFPADAAISKLELDGRTIVTVALRDVTQQKRAEKEQRFLAEASRVLSSSLDYEETLASVGELVVRELADSCVIEIIERNGLPRRLKVVSADPRRASVCARLEELPLDRSRPHLTRAPLETGRPMIIERASAADVEALTQSAEHLQLLQSLGLRSLMALPLSIRGRIVGAVAWISSTPARAYGPGDLPFAEALADRAALAIENGRLYRQAVEATRLREEVLGIVAHDLRSPLAAILMQCKAGRWRPESERRNQRPSEIIERAARRMNRLIRDLLDISKIEAGHLPIERSPISPRQLVLESLEAQTLLTTSAALEIRVEVGAELPDVWADPHRLLQVLENLVGNATKFTPPGGRITVGAEAREREVLFRVGDTGCGIAPADVPHVFDRFWQANRGDRRGAGLGLPIARGIVEAHGGRIWVDSAPQQGTTFSFTIPIALQAAAPGREAGEEGG
ncbi:MAG TPA: PAS domain S-box protein, partial [Polyangia bacterium]